MTTTILMIGGGLLLIATIGVLIPFITQRRRNQSNLSAKKAHDELLTHYERILATIHDLDEDHQAGKLAPATYQRERAYWTEQGINLLQQLKTAFDAVKNEGIAQPAAPVPDQKLDYSIENAIAQLREVRA